jgi:hypothetical protein
MSSTAVEPVTVPAAVPITDFVRALKNALIFACKDQNTPAIWALRIHWDGLRVTVESTDRYRVFSEWITVGLVEGEAMPSEGDVTVYRDQVEKLIKKLAASEKDETVHLATEGQHWGTPADVNRPDRLIVTTTAYGSRGDDYTGKYPIFVADSGQLFINMGRFAEKIRWDGADLVSPLVRFNREFLADVLTRVDPGDKTTPVQLCFASDTANMVGFRFERPDGNGGISGVIMALRAPKSND